mgnify:CR=1 FL=1
MPASVNQALTPSGTMKSGEPPGCAASAPARWRRRGGRSGCARSRPHRSRGRSAAASPARPCALRVRRRTPATRAPRRPDRSSTLMPPTCTSDAGVADPGDCGLHRAAGRGVAARESRGRARRRGVAVRGSGGRPSRSASSFHFRSAPEPARGEVDVVVLEAPVARGCCRGRGRLPPWATTSSALTRGGSRVSRRARVAKGVMRQRGGHRPSLHCRPLSG